jgi:menaquinol-cytochrome c reductase iron-sulfur subunit
LGNIENLNEGSDAIIKNRRIDRRSFLNIATWAVGGLISMGLGIPAVAYIIGPAIKNNKTQNWIKLGSTSKVELGTPALFKAKVERQTGWIVDEEQLSVYILTEDGRDFIGMSNICTHLGCRVRWISDRQQFYCPCHDGVYDKQGNVISGPPPRPLDRYELKVDDKQIFMGKLYRVKG